MEKRQKEKEKEMGLAKKSEGSLTGNQPLSCSRQWVYSHNEYSIMYSQNPSSAKLVQ